MPLTEHFGQDMNTFELPHLLCQLSQRIEHKVRPENFVRMIRGIEQALSVADYPNDQVI